MTSRTSENDISQATRGRTGIEQERTSDSEVARTADLMRLVPKNRSSVLDVGARDGHFSKLLTQYFPTVVALDLEKPTFSFPGVETVAGDITGFTFPDNAFDCVFCTEVLEHISQLQRACDEMKRVARHEVLIGVPYRQDTRVRRVTCRACGKTGPPWGHVNSFDEDRLRTIFGDWPVKEVSFVGTNNEATNPLSAYLMDLAGNPWGSYEQEEGCLHCGARLTPPAVRSPVSRICSAAALAINSLQSRFNASHANWIHILFTNPADR